MRLLGVFAIANRPRAWLALSILSGVVGPAACIAFLHGGRYAFAIDSYLLLLIGTHAAWLAFRGRAARFDALASGVLRVGTWVILPLAAWTGVMSPMFAVLAWRGEIHPRAAIACVSVFTVACPLVFDLNGRRAAETSPGRVEDRVIGVLASFAIPAVVALVLEVAAQRTIDAVLHSDRPLEQLHLERWRWIAPRSSWSELRAVEFGWNGSSDLDPDLRSRIELAYTCMTGADIHDSN
jgi:hypothetical protein